jgi:TolB-like protein/DNA-binding winged helix-turn-helix (wHTH) protein
MTQSLPWGPEVVQFGDYVLNLRTGELLRDGARLLLPEQPFRILALLVRRRGELVTREDLRLQLWSEDTFVDFEHSLNAAIKRLREALGDSAAAPRYIETLPRRGYRFIAAIDERNATTAWREAASAAAASPVVGSTREQPEPSRPIVDSATANFESVTSQWSRVRRASAFGLASALVLGGIVWGVRHWQTESSWRRAGRLDPPVIAVLPLKNLSTESDSGYFVDGLTDEIIRNLAVIRGVQVRSRTSSFAFKDKPRNLREVGEQLGANLVVEGSVLRSGDRLRINASLVDVAGDVTLWSDRFDRQLNDVFAIQDEISRAIVNQLADARPRPASLRHES